MTDSASGTGSTGTGSTGSDSSETGLLNIGHSTASVSNDGFDSGLTALPGIESRSGLFVLSVGADVIEVDRIRQTIQRQPAFIDRVYAQPEIDYCERHRDPAERYAVRFAAKEAVLKAMGVGLGAAELTEMVVIRRTSGQPELQLSGKAAELAADLGVERWLVTLSHADTVAQAFVVALGGVEAQNRSDR